MKWIIAIIVMLVSLLFGACSVAPSDIPSEGIDVAIPVTSGTVVAANTLEHYGRWIEIDPLEGYEPRELEFSNGTVTLTEMYTVPPETTGPLTYTLDSKGTIEVERTFDAFLCEFLELQEVEIAGQTIPIVSLYQMEYDGRGAIITEEYAPEEFVDLFPAGYLSERAQQTLERESTSMMAMNS